MFRLGREGTELTEKTSIPVAAHLHSGCAVTVVLPVDVIRNHHWMAVLVQPCYVNLAFVFA